MFIFLVATISQFFNDLKSISTVVKYLFLYFDFLNVVLDFVCRWEDLLEFDLGYVGECWCLMILLGGLVGELAGDELLGRWELLNERGH